MQHAATASAEPPVSLSRADLAEHHDRARLLLGAGHVAEGIAVLRRLVAARPRSVQLRRHLALALHRSGRGEDALGALLDAIDALPDVVPLLDDAAVVARQLGRDDTVVALRRRAVALDPSPRRWQQLATACRRAGDDAGERDAMAGWSTADPGDPVAAHLAAARGGRHLERASSAYVTQLFDQYAVTFDDHLTDLGYRAPAVVADHLQRALRGALAARACDLGCGTGVLGPLVRPVVERLIGVDLSSGMLDRARGRGYDRLVQADLVEFLADHPASFDALLSADTLNYLGDLAPVFAAAHTAMRRASNAVFVFTLERDDDAAATDGSGYRLCRSGRFAHDEAYVRDEMAAAGFTDVRVVHEILRREGHEPVYGLVVTAVP